MVRRAPDLGGQEVTCELPFDLMQPHLAYGRWSDRWAEPIYVLVREDVMALWQPDPSFYPSPRMAMKAPAETLAYVAAFDPERQQPDAIAVVDVDPASPTYAQIVGTVDDAQCRRRAAPFRLERLLAPACARTRRIRMSSGATWSCRACAPRASTSSTPSPIRSKPKIVKVIEPEEIAEKAGYTRPHTVHCGPEGIYVSALGNAEGKAPGRHLPDGPRELRRARPWEIDRGPQQLAYDFWWHLGHDTMVTSEWGTPDTFENGLVPEVLLGGKYGRRLHFWDLHKRKHLQEIDFGEEHQLVFELRPAHDPTKAYGFVNCVISLKDLSSSIWTWYRDGDKWAVKKIIEIPAEPADPDQLPPLLQGLQGRAAAGHRHRPVDGRPLPLRLLLGHRRPAASTTSPTRSSPKLTGTVRIGGIVVARHAIPAAKNGALNGGPQMVEISRDGKRVYFTNSLYGAIDPQFYPEGIDGWMVKLDAGAGRRHRLRPELLRRLAEGPSAAPGAPGGRRLLVGFLLLSVSRDGSP